MAENGRKFRSAEWFGKPDRDGFLHRSWMKNQGLPHHVSGGPIAAVGGPLGLVHDGDWIALDVAGRALTLEVDAGELAARAAAWRAPVPAHARGYAQLYIDHVTQADRGCDFDFLVGGSGAPVLRESH